MPNSRNAEKQVARRAAAKGKAGPPVEPIGNGDAASGTAASSASSAAGIPLQVLAFSDDPTQLQRQCVEPGCIRMTGNFCDGWRGPCFAVERLGDEGFAAGQRTPICTVCDKHHGVCWFCRAERRNAGTMQPAELFSEHSHVDSACADSLNLTEEQMTDVLNALGFRFIPATNAEEDDNGSSS